MAKLVVTISLDDERDRDLVRWLQGLPRGQRSEVLRDVIRAHMGGNGITLGTLYQEIMELKRLLQSGKWSVVPDDGGDGRDPRLADAARKLQNLGT